MNFIVAVNDINRVHHLERRIFRNNLRDLNNPFEKYTQNEFITRFRFSKETTIFICDMLRENLSRPTQRHDSVSVELQVLSALRFYATGTFQIVLGDLNCLSQSFISKCVAKVSIELANLRQNFISMPTQDEVNVVFQQFYNIAHFPRVVGAIDGTHIPICNPGGLDAQRFFNRKQFYSINVQACCDHKYAIRSIVARWPGSVHDARIFHESNLKERFENGEIPGILLGDNGYACENYLLTPLLQPRTQPERAYNSAHKRTRGTVERTFGILKRRFPCLRFPLRLKLQTTYATIIAVAVLHNIAILHNELEIPDDQLDVEEVLVLQDNQNDQARGIAFRRAFIEMNFR